MKIRFRKPWVVDRSDESNLVAHADKELRLAGLHEPDADYGGMLYDAVMDHVRLFATQGHSGMSASITTHLLGKVLRYEPLSPLTFAADEWMEIEPGLWQNRRRPSVFTNDLGETWYDVDEPGHVLHENIKETR